MTIQELIDNIQAISLKHKQIKSFTLGNVWDVGDSKSSQIYPAVWFETPVLIAYNSKNKTYGFSLNVLALAKQDNIPDEISIQSQCEEIADTLLRAIQNDIKYIGVENQVGLTIKNINADLAVGVRIDLTCITNRICDYKTYYNDTLD